MLLLSVQEVFTDEFYMYRAKVEMCPRQVGASYVTSEGCVSA